MPVLIRILFFLCIAWQMQAQNDRIYTIQTVPDPKRSGSGYVSDPDNILSSADKAEINQRIANIENETTAQIAVVLLRSIGQENPKEFATRLFAHWGIGKSDKDNGLLILSVMDQKRTEFETGYGMEAVLPDAYCYRIGMQELVPSYREGRYGEGLVKTINRIGEILQNPENRQDIVSTEAPGATARNTGRWKSIFPSLLLAVIAFLHFGYLLFLVFRMRWVMHSKDNLYDKYLSIRPLNSAGFLLLAPAFFPFAYFVVNRLLDKLRNQPRYSKINGKLMRKMSEAEEDRFLERGQITEEDIGSVDYDVWTTEEEDDVLILRYARQFSKYTECPKCRYRTWYLARSSIVKAPTYTSTGIQEKLYLCKNCDYRKVEHKTLPKLQQAASASAPGGFTGRSGHSGSGSWGGGRSGGGGAGVSW